MKKKKLCKFIRKILFEDLKSYLNNLFEIVNNLKNSNDNKDYDAKLKTYLKYKKVVDNYSSKIDKKKFERLSELIELEKENSKNIYNNNNDQNRLQSSLLSNSESKFVEYQEVVDQKNLVENRDQNIKQINTTAKQINNIAIDLNIQIDQRDSKLDLILRDQVKIENNALKTRNEAIKTEKLTNNKKGYLKWLILSVIILIIIIVIIVIAVTRNY